MRKPSRETLLNRNEIFDAARSNSLRNSVKERKKERMNVHLTNERITEKKKTMKKEEARKRNKRRNKQRSVKRKELGRVIIVFNFTRHRRAALRIIKEKLAKFPALIDPFPRANRR